ncbi:RNA polymerase, sigma-24 subunit, ECF subfamily [Chthoniobacter flavus Ellin428]|uniref:RNA polymerase, sigma-24 subunit, ECF subfamily n=1 Tax=Chthoniobacter flavus Ellin428 TaxID=497964 RepID=B4CU84_9BACT|nr:RNA polymerase sigma factor [Chthoniobacter flavus]EDY22122.1 RNA polymerase, sigma-24 subunit, ECF subfamily [Chthoniobacter flavus Ellin428]TCO94845.1 RNA polymerase sigma-70 factor (ECF subfamily) [Chthoniobacter flavus]
MQLPPATQILAEHRRAVLLYVYACCRDLPLAEDIVQETMLIAHRKEDQYFPEADFTCWLCSIARHVWYRERKKQQREQDRRRALEEQLPLLLDTERHSEARFELERRALADCMEKLPDLDREVIRQHFEGGLKYSEIASALQRSVAWVKVRMFRTRAALNLCLRQSLQSHET